MNNSKDELVICIYNENGPSINEIILEAFECYLKSQLHIDEFS